MLDANKMQASLKQMRALLQDGRERISALRPAWGAHLAGETLRRLGESVDELEALIDTVSQEEGEPASTGVSSSKRKETTS